MAAEHTTAKVSFQELSGASDDESSGVFTRVRTSPANDVEPDELDRLLQGDSEMDRADDFGDLWPRPEVVSAWQARSDRRRAVRTAGRAAIFAVALGFLGIAATRAGGDSIASWMTMAHHTEVRAQVTRVLDQAEVKGTVSAR